MTRPIIKNKLTLYLFKLSPIERENILQQLKHVIEMYVGSSSIEELSFSYYNM